MTRLTRAQSQQQTRILLIEEATELFLERGFSVTSVDEIAERAGFTRGAVYSNFGGKTEIGLAVIDGLYESVGRAAGKAALPAVDEGTMPWIEAVLGSLEDSIGDPRWARLEVEVAAACSPDQLQVSFGRRFEAMRSSWQPRFRAARQSGELAADPDDLALLLVSAIVGVGLQRAADPSISSERVLAALRLVATAAVR